MKEFSAKKSISGLAALILLVVFASGIFSVLLNTAGVYKRLSERNAASYDKSIGIQYLANKVRQAPSPEAITLSEFGDGESLVICEQFDGFEYQTVIYCHEGWLMELFSLSSAGLAPEAGEKILQAKSFEAKSFQNLLQLKIEDYEGHETSVLINLRGSGGQEYEE